MLNKSFFMGLLCVSALTFSLCAGSGAGTGSKGGNNDADTDLDKLWAMLIGYWKTTMPDAPNVFYFFGYDDDQKPIGYVVWYDENDETEYVTNVEKLNDSNFRVTLEVPANYEEDGLYEAHEGYTKIMDIDVSRYSEKLITITSLDVISEWIFAGITAEERTFDTF